MKERPAYRLPREVVPEHYSLVFEPDFSRAAFGGEATVQLRVEEPTTEVVLNAAELEISAANIIVGDGGRRPAKISYRPDEEQVVLSLDAPLAPGTAGLELAFSGQLNDLLHGFYRSKFRAVDGQERWIAATQFESTDARRAFPCWDEPDLKATFGITIVADDGLTVLSNASEASSELVANGKRRTTFKDTVKLSTYLVAMLVGPFELTDPGDVDGVALRIASVPGRGALTGLAGEAAAHALSFLSNYFSMPYPTEKLDHAAIPDFASGAMENLGLVTYRETALLVGQESSQVERQRVVATIAHETAHMWFGDLVTMRWWEGIWLNEAFATFMELLVTDDFDPRWQVWTNFGLDRAAALATDGLRATRSIEYPVGRPEEAEDMFDVITYDKGGSVLRMIERHLGDEAFRRGLNLYLGRHSFANTDTTDLWDALEEASGQPVRSTMGTWVNQPGHPLVSAELSGPTELRLSQRRFLLDGGTADPEQLWAVPVTLRYATEDGTVERDQLLLQDQSATVPLKGQPSWLLVNESGWGVYRVHYSDDLGQRLFGVLGDLDDRERLSLVSDTWAAAVAGLVPVVSAVALWSALRNDHDPDVWWGISGGLDLIDLVCPDHHRGSVQRLARDLTAELFGQVGWVPPEGAGPEETPRQARLRARLITILGTLGADEEVQSEARRRLADSATGRAPLPPELATAVAQVAASSGGESEWEMLYSQYKRAVTPQDEVRYLHALGGFSSPGLIWRSLELAFSDEVRSQDAPYLLRVVLGRREGSTLAWEAIEEHWDQMQARWPSNSIQRMLEAIPALAAGGEAATQRAIEWLDGHHLVRGELRLRQARERLLINLGFKQRIGPQLPGALATGTPPDAR